ncbi:hypothetical protein [Aeoliella sp.]|uniref:hypothetical protein n=1 Tax=Aeoliella sp. TaxID=2795800 RepID=UPI003CCC3E93
MLYCGRMLCLVAENGSLMVRLDDGTHDGPLPSLQPSGDCVFPRPTKQQSDDVDSTQDGHWARFGEGFILRLSRR